MTEERNSVAWDKVDKFTDKFEGEDIRDLYAPDNTQDKVEELQFVRRVLVMMTFNNKRLQKSLTGFFLR
jgi:hypothetical protein